MDRSVVTMPARTADGAMLADEQGVVVLWNKAAERLLGFSAAEVIGRPCHDVMRGETFAGHPFCSPSCAVGHRLDLDGKLTCPDARRGGLALSLERQPMTCDEHYLT